MAKQIHLRPPEIEVPENRPFENDILEREPIGNTLTEFVSRLRGPYVLAIDAPWGSGKTTFIRMWEQQLRAAQFKTLFFNAWQNDHTQDPFAALVAELEQSIAARFSDVLPAQDQLRETRKLAIQVAKRAVPAALRLLTAGILNLPENYEKELGDVAGGLASDRIGEHTAAKAAVEEFKASLARLALALGAGEGAKPLVIFVDELDRCRPSYSIQLLESAKHLFDVPGIVFVLAIDRPQLCEAIRAIYGSGFRSEGYLRRFIDLDYALPAAKPGAFVSHLFERLGIIDEFKHRPRRDVSTLQRTAELLAKAMGFSLREQIQAIARIGIILNTIPRNHFVHEIELATLVFLREWRRDLFDKYSNGEVDQTSIIEALRTSKEGRDGLDDRLGTNVEAVLAAGAIDMAQSDGPAAKYLGLEGQKSASKEQKERAERILIMIGNRRNQEGNPIRETLERLRLASGFFHE